MTRHKIAIIDYGVGNLLSVQRALEYCGAEISFVSDMKGVLSADKLVLPGVGAFGNAMQTLERLNLSCAIKKASYSGVPILGICLGMQLLFEESEEFGINKGLGLVPGRITKIPNLSADGGAIETPHIGWSPLNISNSSSIWGESILSDTSDGEFVYFVHSYMASPSVGVKYIALTNYEGHKIVAAIQNKNIIGCQFHPEKSGAVGLKILKKFVSLW